MHSVSSRLLEVPLPFTAVRRLPFFRILLHISAPKRVDLISYKISARGLRGIGFKQRRRRSDASDRFFLTVPLTMSCTVAVYLLFALFGACLPKTVFCFLISAFCLPLAHHSNSWVLLSSLVVPGRPGEEKGIPSVCLHLSALTTRDVFRGPRQNLGGCGIRRNKLLRDEPNGNYFSHVHQRGII